MPIFVFAQIGTDKPDQQKIDTTNYYYIIKGDSIPREFIDLEEVILLTKLQFTSKEDRRRYLILRAKDKKSISLCKASLRTFITYVGKVKDNEKKKR